MEPEIHERDRQPRQFDSIYGNPAESSVIDLSIDNSSESSSMSEVERKRERVVKPASDIAISEKSESEAEGDSLPSSSGLGRKRPSDDVASLPDAQVKVRRLADPGKSVAYAEMATSPESHQTVAYSPFKIKIKNDVASSRASSSEAEGAKREIQTASRKPLDSTLKVSKESPGMATSSSSNRQVEARPKFGEPKFDPLYVPREMLPSIPETYTLPPLTSRERLDLETVLKFDDDPERDWREDWSGNLQYIEDIVSDKNLSLKESCRYAGLLFFHVTNMKETPHMTRKILANALQRPARSEQERLSFIQEAIRRISFDPEVLKQDGWTIRKASSPQGVSGRAYHIGKRLLWQREEAVVIAFVYDVDMGDLWKAMWSDGYETFDLEAHELNKAIKAWEMTEEKKKKPKHGASSKPRSQGSFSSTSEISAVVSNRFAATADFTVEGIEQGIILAASSDKNAVPGVFWPARVMYESEVKAHFSWQSAKRSSSKNTVGVVFLCPYWFDSKGSASSVRASLSDSVGMVPSEHLFEMEMIEVSDATIKAYPYEGTGGELSFDSMRTEFKFLGLPQRKFGSFLNSHRLALSLQKYAQNHLVRSAKGSTQVGFAHVLSTKTARFPSVVLELPFHFILGNIPALSDIEEDTESILDLHAMVDAMRPPRCWGKELRQKGSADKENLPTMSAQSTGLHLAPHATVSSSANGVHSSTFGGERGAELHDIASQDLLRLIGNTAPLMHLSDQLKSLLHRLGPEIVGNCLQKGPAVVASELRSLLRHCTSLKYHGEDMLLSTVMSKSLSKDWRLSCERIFKLATVELAGNNTGNGITAVITDSRCNEHITGSGSFERAVRLPAAIQAAKQAGAGRTDNFRLITSVDDRFVEIAETKVIPMAHKKSYIKRMKAKVEKIPPKAKGFLLTSDSEGGGGDTKGSRGSYMAAVAGVAAAIQGVDMLVSGQCVNIFCAVRPPGHHAGRELHPMKATSNGFCVLNPVACAALYATLPQSQGGLGLKRVCVIDFDVHHGNGTQDVLCSTFDPRFLYVSLHAGGNKVNGAEEDDKKAETEDSDADLRASLGSHRCDDGIFPGRCGDTSPHEGVINMPLGRKMTAQAVGIALRKVIPAIESFSPDLIILSAGFDAHKNDPLGLGDLAAADFGSITNFACGMAFKHCSGRVLSILEGGYGVPCCRPQKDLFLPEQLGEKASQDSAYESSEGSPYKSSQDSPYRPTQALPVDNLLQKRPPAKLLYLGEDLPNDMVDPVPYKMQQLLDKCHREGFLECVKEHVSSLARASDRRVFQK